MFLYFYEIYIFEVILEFILLFEKYHLSFVITYILEILFKSI